MEQELCSLRLSHEGKLVVVPSRGSGWLGLADGLELSWRMMAECIGRFEAVLL